MVSYGTFRTPHPEDCIVATDAQINANILNSRRSTGPRTAEGKARACKNSLKHGLTGSGTVLVEGDEKALEDRFQAYTAEFQPESPHEFVLVAEMALDDVRMKRCGKLFDILCDGYATRAQLCWDQDRRLEAEDLAARLRHDPSRIALRLQRTAQGCALMIERWEALGRIFRETAKWSEAQRSLALDLLGVPTDLREGRTPVDARETLPPADARAFRLGVVDTEIARLTQRKEEILDPLDADERAIAEAGIGAEVTPALQRLHRYESACWRRYSKALKYFTDRNRKRQPAEAPGPPEPRPTAPPAPAPVRGPRPVPDPHDYGLPVAATRPRPVTLATAAAVTPAPVVTAPVDEPRRANRRERRRLAKLQRQA
jgi:hypothetical protein